MTVDHHIHNEKIVHGSLFQTLTLVFAGMTLLFAIFSIVIGSRLSALTDDQLKAIEKSNTLETESIEQIKTTLKSVQANYEAAQKEAAVDKKKANQLAKKLSATQKELVKIKSDLDAASKTISALKTTQPEKPESAIVPSPTESLPASDIEPSAQPPIPQKDSPSAQPPLQKSDQPAASTRPDPSITERPQEKPSSAVVPVPDNHSPDLSPTAAPATVVDKKAGTDASPAVNQTISNAPPPPQPSIETEDLQ